MKIVSCDGLGAHPLQLLRAQLRSFLRPPEWGHADGKDVIDTYWGRNAIALLCRLIGLRPGDSVLPPAYNCGAETDPFIKAGARVVLYDVGRDLSIDLDGIARTITPSTHVVYVTHSFGVAQMLPSNYFVEKQAEWTMSRVSRGILQSAGVTDIVEIRQPTFNHLFHPVGGIQGISPVIAPLPESACPMAFPFVVADRADWYSRSELWDILVQGWPRDYPGFDWDAYPHACHLRDRLLILPVHRNLTPAHTEYIAESVREVARQGRAESRC